MLGESCKRCYGFVTATPQPLRRRAARDALERWAPAPAPPSRGDLASFGPLAALAAADALALPKGEGGETQAVGRADSMGGAPP
jgi:hypothetical protein